MPENSLGDYLFLSPAKLVVATVENDIGSFEGNVAKDGLAATAVGLKSTKTLTILGSVVQQAAVDGDLSVTNAERQVGKLRIAVKDPTTLAFVVGRSRNLLVIIIDNGIVDKEQSGASVGDAVDRVVAEAGGESPPALAAVDGRVDDVLGGAGDAAKDVATSRVVTQIGNKQRAVELRLDIVKPRLGRVGRHGVEHAKGQSEKTVAVAVGELRRDLLRRLDDLVLDGQAADRHRVGVDITRAARAVRVLDGPGLAGLLLGRLALAGAVQVVAARVGRLGGEDPEVGAARVKVEVELLRGRADGDLDEVVEVALVRVGHGGAFGALLGVGLAGRVGRLLERVRDGDAVLGVGAGEGQRSVAADKLLVASLLELDDAGLGRQGSASSHGGRQGCDEPASKGCAMHFEYCNKILCSEDFKMY